MSNNYYRTLIAVADDCPVTRSQVPVGRGGKPTVAVLQYEMLRDGPRVHTQEDVLFGVWLRQHGPADPPPAEVARLREQFFARPQACLRTSPLPKKYGFGLLFDGDGRVTLCPMESEQYRQALAGRDIKVVRAMRSSRA
jgi:hypothetical protein